MGEVYEIRKLAEQYTGYSLVGEGREMSVLATGFFPPSQSVPLPASYTPPLARFRSLGGVLRAGGAECRRRKLMVADRVE